MLRTVQEQVLSQRVGALTEFWAGEIPEGLPRIAMRPSPAQLRRNLLSANLQGTARALAKGAALSLPSRWTERLTKHIPAREVSTLLDSSGFAYGDGWPIHRIKTRLKAYRRLRRQGTRLVILPQAFGPFTRPDVREAARELFNLCDLVFARDAESLSHLEGLNLSQKPEIGLCPDITFVHPGTPRADADEWAGRVCIVPNTRMIDRTSPETAAAYLAAMQSIISEVYEQGYEPWLVLHEANDAQLLERLQTEASMPLNVLDIDATETKGVFAVCRAVVASRYHALISSLSSGTPVLGMSWSHKYDMLFQEFGHTPYLLKLPLPEAEVRTRLRELLNSDSGAEIRRRLLAHSNEKKLRVREMWDQVNHLIATEDK